MNILMILGTLYDIKDNIIIDNKELKSDLDIIIEELEKESTNIEYNSK